ncbi:MAG: hypothetical protein IKT52_08485 [Oscillospiraceae bacterium]|nr:hypothetical protein [Oscillospiraceae bacterium]
MKKYIRFLCIALALSMLLAIPAYAESAAEPRGSAFFAAYGTDLYKASSTSFEIWFDVDANLDMMDVIGVSEIIVYRSANGQSGWSEVRTYDMDDYPEMTTTYDYSHTNYVTYNNAWSGYYYRAYITFYAKNSRGIGERYVYTEIIRM